MVLGSKPSPLRLALLGVAGVACGFALARASLDVDRARAAEQAQAPTESTEPAESAGAETAAAPTARGDTPAEAPADRLGAPAGSDVGAETAVEPGADPAPEFDPSAAALAEAPPTVPSALTEAAPPATAAGGATGAPSLRFVPGRIAYLRCDGGGATPPACPRALDVERKVTTALGQLGRCADAPTAPGRADVRLVFDGPHFSGFGFRDLAAPALPTAALERCLGPLARTLVQSTGATRLTIAFAVEAVGTP